MSAAVITNTSGRMVTLVLEHEKAKRTHKVHVQQNRTRDGELKPKRVRLSLPNSLMLLAGQTTEELPGWVAMCPDVRRQQKLGYIRVDRVESTPEKTDQEPKDVVKHTSAQRSANKSRSKTKSFGGKD
jgi:hypothetical protein